MTKTLACLPLFLLVAQAQAAPSFARLPLRFEENRGQIDARARYVARQGGLTLFMTDEGAVLTLRSLHGVRCA